MRKGFFNLKNNEGYNFLETLNVNNEIIDAFYMLHGICHEFALAINEVYGYNIVFWVNYDEEIETNVLIHAFNVFKYKDKQYFVDIRGVTDNLEDIINEFDYFEEISEPVEYNNKNAKKVLKKLGLNIDVNKDIYEVIKYYKSYYQLNN
ncbi:MAG: hypothetical protein K0R54_791 [Clostridiaceae bacterium]|jgi:hypothetical protein|nr:hypothetical protein [Clostridiaceae bacterium]